MTPLHIIFLAAVQGVTEFLPISSSGHLILIPIFTDFPDQGLLLDIAVHVGSLGAVIGYFWQDSWSALKGLSHLLRGRASPSARLTRNLVIATIPILGAGLILIFSDLIKLLRSAEIIGWTMLGFGILLYVADRTGVTVRRIEQMPPHAALLIGIAQIAALIPGTSRAGITITAARFLGYGRIESTRFSMLLSIPTIIAAGSVSIYGILDSGSIILSKVAFLSAGAALVAALLAISILMSWLKQQSFTPFVIYRIVLGLGLLYWVYS